MKSPALVAFLRHGYLALSAACCSNVGGSLARGNPGSPRGAGLPIWYKSAEYQGYQSESAGCYWLESLQEQTQFRRECCRVEGSV